MDSVRRLRAEQLEYVRGQSVLIYSRERSTNILGKKLKAVFNRMYITAEIKDCQKIIAKFSHDVTDSKPVIDIVLIDFDTSAVKVVDYVNKRVHTPEFSQCPIIPVIVMANEQNSPREITELLRTVGGCNKVIGYPYTTQNVVFAIMEVACMVRDVEQTFLDLKKAVVAKAKLPYVPVFDAKSAAKVKEVDGEMVKVSVATSMSALDHHKVEEIDDCGSDTDSVLPDYLQDYRRKPKDRSSRYDFSNLSYGGEKGHHSHHSHHSHHLQTNDKHKVAITQVTEDTRIGSPDAEALRLGSATEGRFGSGFALIGARDSVISKTTNGVQVDSKVYAETLLGEDSTAVSSHSNELENIGEEPQQKQPGEDGDEKSDVELPPMQRLLDKGIRPFWSGFMHAPPPLPMAEVDPLVAKAKNRTDMEHDISTFVNKPRPHTAHKITVGGLDKKVIDGYWKQLKGGASATATAGSGMSRPSSAINLLSHPSSGRTDGKHPPQQKGSRPNTAGNSRPSSTGNTPRSNSTHQLGNIKVAGKKESGQGKKDDLHRAVLLRSSAQGNKDEVRKGKNSKKNQSEMMLSTDDEDDRGWSSPLLHSFDVLDLNSSPTTHHGPKRVGSTSPQGQQQKDAAAATAELNAAVKREYQASLQAERKIGSLAKDVPPDFQVSSILEIDLSKRRINLGEKGMLERGLGLEKDGDYESAAICYTRAGAHSKDQQISRMLLGNLHYRANHLMLALRFYNLAIDLLENLSEGMRIVQDEFLGYYNRAVINFRLGNDSQGLQDLTKAVGLNPKHLQARELLSLAKRRMGLYYEAMEDALLVKTQRIEENRIAKEAADKLQTKRAKAVKYDVEGRIITTSRPRSGGIVAGTVLPAHQQGILADIERELVRQRGEQHGVMSKTQSTTKGSVSAANTALLRGIEIEVPQPSCNSSLRERVAMHRDSSAADMLGEGNGGSGSGSHGGGSLLRLFKMAHGMKQELFDELFVQPSELQTSLLRDPHLRTPQDISIIATSALHQFPFLRSLSTSIVHELAAVIEYRTLSGGSRDPILFKQNQESGGVCFLLRGTVGVAMETAHVSAMQAVDLGKLPEYSTCGQFDLLFQHPRSSFIKSLEEIMVRQRSHVTDMPVDHVSSHHGSHHMSSMMGPSHNSNDFTQLQQQTAGGVSSGLIGGGGTVASASQLLLQQQHQAQQQAQQAEAQFQREQQDFQQLWYHQVDHVSGAHLSRGIQPGMFMTYTMQSACELLLLNERDFYRILYDHTVQAFQKRVQTLRSCGIFKSWKHEDVLRLARMCQVFTYKRGDVVLAQGTKPEYLYVVQQGLLKVMKRPNRTEMLTQKLSVAREKADRIDLKYVYHHGLYNTRDTTFGPLRDLSSLTSQVVAQPTNEDMGLVSTVSSPHSSKQRGGKASGIPSSPSVAGAAGTGKASPRRQPAGNSIGSTAGDDDSSSHHRHAGQSSPGHKHGHESHEAHRSMSPLKLQSVLDHHTDHRPFSPNHTHHHTASGEAKEVSSMSTHATSTHHNNNSVTGTPATGTSRARRSSVAHDASLTHGFGQGHGAKGNNRSLSKASLKKRPFRSLEEMLAFPTTQVLPPAKLTVHEKERQELSKEIAKLEGLIQKAQEQDALDQRLHETMDQLEHQHALRRANSLFSINSTVSNNNNHSPKGHSPFAHHSHGNIPSDASHSSLPTLPAESALASQLNRKHAEIALLQWPLIFGEACVLEPENGISRGSIEADTTCEVLAIHRMQLQTFPVDDAFLDRVRDKAVVYPGDPDIVVSLYRKQNWDAYRQEVMQGISKHRWPARIDDLEAFVV